ncbi:MAG TPA: glutamyl-tRNA reductase [Deltaproteobacteria bacterium]|nr:glutamyl-tRNA reductase [Deltaproteobacteria bacterium]HIJ40992.1 glutamyl-tRNA reductase [Deltaproteobacteria bacterium]
MVKIISIGMNHETAPLALRECLAPEADSDRHVLAAMRNMEAIREGLFLSTCNRVEALFTTEDPDQAKKAILTILSELGRIPEERLSASLYTYEDLDAVRHIFTVASSLDSMVVGEPQILGQIKSAYAKAVKEKTSGVILNRLMHKAFHVAKRVRTETGICSSAVSISYAAVELAKKIFHLLKGKKVLLIGAGEMAELAARHLIANGVESISVANRTFERAVQIAKAFDGLPVSFDEIPQQILDADIVITSTASKEFVISHSMVKNLLKKRRNRPLFFIDIAVPRDVEPTVNNLNNVYLYDIDDLRGVIELNMNQRQQEAVKAERIISEEVIKFGKWLKTLKVVPTIISLRNKAETIVQAEIKKSSTALSDLTPAQRQVIEILSRSIVQKVLSDPILFLKGKSDRSTLDLYLDMTRRLFSLDIDGDNT